MTSNWRKVGEVVPELSDPETPFFSDRFTEALKYAVKMHNTQARKGSHGRVAYAGHLLGVCSMVIEEGGNETQAIAALLHDAAEDHGGQKTLGKIRDRFGDGVADIVDACTDSFEEEGMDKPDWLVRKKAYLAKLKDRGEPELLVSLADKLYNARAILHDYDEILEERWARFNAGRDAQLWYYEQLSEVFSRLLPSNRMARQLAEIVAELDRLDTRDVEAGRLPARKPPRPTTKAHE